MSPTGHQPASSGPLGLLVSVAQPGDHPGAVEGDSAAGSHVAQNHITLSGRQFLFLLFIMYTAAISRPGGIFRT